MRALTLCLCVIYLSGCTVAGVLIDGQAQSNARANKYSNSPARSEPYKNPLEPLPMATRAVLLKMAREMELMAIRWGI